MKIAWIVMLAMGCGGAAAQTTPTQQTQTPQQTALAGMGAGSTASGGDVVARGCATIAAVHARTPCEFLTKANFDEPGCNEAFGRDGNAGGPMREAIDTAMGCSADAATCEDVLACLMPLTEPTAPADERTCGDGGFGPLSLTADEADARTGLRAARFSDVPATKDEPVEVCSVRGQTGWLTRVTCDDGTNPFGGDANRAYDARVGSVGGGGRCGHVIDLYEVPCPEATYQVHMDFYMCGPGESFQ